MTTMPNTPDAATRLPSWQPVEEVILAASGPFSRGRQARRRKNSTNYEDSPSFSLLDPDENTALSPTEHFFNGLLVLCDS